MITSTIHNLGFAYACISTTYDQETGGHYLCGLQLGSTIEEAKLNTISLFGWSKDTIIDETFTTQHNSRIFVDLKRLIDDGHYFNLEWGFSIQYLTGTKFQHKVWNYLREEIVPGLKVSYKTIAEHIGHPNAYRAVATACANNPIAIIVPCHCVVRNDGKETRFRWGNEIRQELLRKESI